MRLRNDDPIGAVHVNELEQTVDAGEIVDVEGDLAKRMLASGNWIRTDPPRKSAPASLAKPATDKDEE